MRVALYLDAPAGPPLTTAELTLPPSGQQTLTHEWSAVRGSHTLYAIIETEDDEPLNNVALLRVTVNAAPQAEASGFAWGWALATAMLAAVGGAGLALWWRRERAAHEDVWDFEEDGFEMEFVM